MNFSTAGKSYNNPSTNSGSVFPQTNESTETAQTAKDGNDNVEGEGAMFNLRINRVNSKEQLHKQEGYNPQLTNSLVHKNVQRSGNQSTLKMISSVDKRINGDNANSRSYASKFSYATFKTNHMQARYADDDNNSDGEEGEPKYKKIQHISDKMISSVISRESHDRSVGGSAKNYLKPLSNSSRGNRQDQQQQAYDLYASRHPSESIRKSTIEISKAISSNAITELQRQNEHQGNTIKRLEKQLQDFKESFQKWKDDKHQFQVDNESKSRHIEELLRQNQSLHGEIETLRNFRTMETVEQVVIASLKTQVMQINKKMIEMQTQFYRKEKVLMQKYKGGNVNLVDIGSDRETIQKLQINVETEKKRVELISQELEKEKQKSWQLIRQKQQTIADNCIARESLERELINSKQNAVNLNKQVEKYIAIAKDKDSDYEQLKRAHTFQIQKLNDKNKEAEHQITKVKAQLTQQLQAKQKQNNQKIIEQQKKVTQKKIEQQVIKQKSLFESQQAKVIKEKQISFTQKLEQQKRVFEVQLSTKLAQKQQQIQSFKSRPVVDTQLQQKYNSTLNELNSLKSQIALLQQKAKQYQNQVNSLRSQSSPLQQKVKQYETQLNTLRTQTSSLQQKAKLHQVELNKANDGINVWKTKAQNIQKAQNSANQSIVLERDELKSKVKELEQVKQNPQFKIKLQHLQNQHEILKQKLKAKQQQSALYSKIKQYYSNEQLKTGNLNKLIKELQNKLNDCQARFEPLLTKIQLEEYKYKQLADKMTSDSQTYMEYIQKLQQANELVIQKYNKLRTLCRKSNIKVNDDNEVLDKQQHNILKQYLQKQILSQFTKMIIPAFQSKIGQKISACDSSVANKQKKLMQLKFQIEAAKKRRQKSLK